jgi:hypothetical protein
LCLTLIYYNTFHVSNSHFGDKFSSKLKFDECAAGVDDCDCEYPF